MDMRTPRDEIPYESKMFDNETVWKRASRLFNLMGNKRGCADYSQAVWRLVGTHRERNSSFRAE
jgi:hypothetical protein